METFLAFLLIIPNLCLSIFSSCRMKWKRTTTTLVCRWPWCWQACHCDGRRRNVRGGIYVGFSGWLCAAKQKRKYSVKPLLYSGHSATWAKNMALSIMLLPVGEVNVVEKMKSHRCHYRRGKENGGVIYPELHWRSWCPCRYCPVSFLYAQN